MPFHLLDLLGDALADGDAAAADADDHQLLCAAIFLQNFDGHAPDRAGHAGTVEQPFLDVHRMCGERGRGRIAHRSWQLAVGSWQLAVGCWLLAVGCWLLTVDGWPLAVACWPLAVARCLLA